MHGTLNHTPSPKKKKKKKKNQMTREYDALER